MSGVFGGGAGRRTIVALALLSAVMAAPARAETLSIAVDQASIVKLPAQVSTIIIGNPMIADASLQRGGILIVTGKSFGATNLMALDRTGAVLMERNVEVLGPAGHDMVVVYRGVERETYSCAPNCERRITLGDSAAYFNTALAQSGARNAAAATK